MRNPGNAATAREALLFPIKIYNTPCVVPGDFVPLPSFVVSERLHHHTHGSTALGEKVGDIVSDLENQRYVLEVVPTNYLFQLNK